MEDILNIEVLRETEKDVRFMLELLIEQFKDMLEYLKSH